MKLKRVYPPFHSRFFLNGSIVVFFSVTTVVGTIVTCNMTLQIEITDGLTCEWVQQAIFSGLTCF